MQIFRSFRYKLVFWAYVWCAAATFGIIFLYEPALKLGIPSDQHVRFLGMTLQLIGAVTVWYDLTHTATGFGAGPSLTKAWTYIKSVFVAPRIEKKSYSMKVEGASLTITGGQVTVTQGKPTVQQRLDELEKSTRQLKQKMSKIESDLSVQQQELTNTLNQRVAELREEIESLETQLKSAFTGNFSVLSFGIVWLMVGIVLTSIPAEVTDLARYFSLYDMLR